MQIERERVLNKMSVSELVLGLVKNRLSETAVKELEIIMKSNLTSQ